MAAFGNPRGCDRDAFGRVLFEHLVRQLFEAMGMKSWVTQASKG
jgi:hypothetical protein